MTGRGERGVQYKEAVVEAQESAKAEAKDVCLVESIGQTEASAENETGLPRRLEALHPADSLGRHLARHLYAAEGPKTVQRLPYQATNGGPGVESSTGSNYFLMPLLDVILPPP
ncbi:hypothetical protein Vretimale_17184 [Volvox reticuliferus]|uniref:Uncharacterized protein n=1 Tax=Volvox reticuliferus TaxID=1737510 RepID=A0A8J4GUT2_9CHLO|nr:hypothetical protein Vretimale_17184 [Volvox reticuliferus]